MLYERRLSPRGRPTHDYLAAYHICHARLFIRVPRRGGPRSFAWREHGPPIETCLHCGQTLVAADVRSWNDLQRHPKGVGQALRAWSRARRRAARDMRNGSD
jgi:hypothetical protein